MHPMLTIAKRAALEAGDVLNKYFQNQERLNIVEKQKNDFVSEADLSAEKVIIETIKKAYPNHAILSEESGELGDINAEYCWVIDPLDGTTNFVKGFAHFSVSIALLKKQKLEIGLVYSPMNHEIFSASRGGGAMLNDRKIRVSNSLPDRAIIATGIPFKAENNDVLLPKTVVNIKNVLTQFPDIRRTGSAALDLCYVACGRFDGYFEWGLSPWDIAAGALIAQEAGAIVSDTVGELTHLQSGHIVAAPTKVYRALIKALR